MEMSKVLQESRLEGRRGRRGTRGERDESPTRDQQLAVASSMKKEKSWENFLIKIVSTTNRLDASFSQFAVCKTFFYYDLRKKEKNKKNFLIWISRLTPQFLFKQ